MNIKNIYNGAKVIAGLGLLALTMGCNMPTLPKHEQIKNTMIPFNGKNYSIRYGSDAERQSIVIYSPTGTIFANNYRTFDNGVETTDDQFDELKFEGNDPKLREAVSLNTIDRIWKDLH